MRFSTSLSSKARLDSPATPSTSGLPQSGNKDRSRLLRAPLFVPAGIAATETVATAGRLNATFEGSLESLASQRHLVNLVLVS